MLPSRSRLISWNPDSLQAASKSISSAGVSVYQAVRNLDDGCDRLPEARTWSGGAHEAATGMFAQATRRASHFQNYTEAVSEVLSRGSGLIGKARTDLLREADEIDKGELNVTDQWVVLIDPAGMSAEKAAGLQKQAESAQMEINRLLTAVGDADQETAQKLLLARTGRESGGAFNDVQMPGPRVLPPRPGDEVPDPRTPDGKTLQDITRAGDMATTVREQSETEDNLGNKITTLTMLDGSKQVITEFGGSVAYRSFPEGTVKVEHIGRNGNHISDTYTYHNKDGSTRTDITWGDGTQLSIAKDADGNCLGGVTVPGVKSGVLPDTFFTHPIPAAAGASFSGLEKQAGRGIPILSADALDNVKVRFEIRRPSNWCRNNAVRSEFR
ncbi:hypothetical protein FR943_05075 [Mycobacterium sp. TNTM28]|uniref:ESX-1 secretion-associated protein EspA/EspE-like domain-containing protein n=1 Tax=[Mycobacterium] fortunisiensis TaxID=2600579 RepID=A0ABS6KI08_9MYCO|nr:hypothetical protein [[Mycobacterium] fortunisiensis]MBU9763217.1 hypothetical protein [[Mycobacterium] fortunisiensis]